MPMTQAKPSPSPKGSRQPTPKGMQMRQAPAPQGKAAPTPKGGSQALINNFQRVRPTPQPRPQARPAIPAGKGRPTMGGPRHRRLR
jgi:hypothetical protein